MVTITVVVPAPGLHARPAALVAQQAAGFTSEVTLVKDGKAASARSVLGLMALGLTAGTAVVVQASGSDEAAAAAAVAAVVRSVGTAGHP